MASDGYGRQIPPSNKGQKISPLDNCVSTTEAKGTKYTVDISDEGLEIRVNLLSDMPDVIKWALSNTSPSLHPVPTLIVSKGP